MSEQGNGKPLEIGLSVDRATRGRYSYGNNKPYNGKGNYRKRNNDYYNKRNYNNRNEENSNVELYKATVTEESE